MKRTAFIICILCIVLYWIWYIPVGRICRARRLSRTDSQIFEDSVELQAYYIEQRDILCRNTLVSPALNFTRDTMTTSVELVKQCKLLQENDEDDETRYVLI